MILKNVIDIWKDLTINCIGKIHWFNDSFSSDFNFEHPITSVETIESLSQESKPTIAFCSNDPDADRHVLIDEKGRYITLKKLRLLYGILFALRKD